MLSISNGVLSGTLTGAVSGAAPASRASESLMSMAQAFEYLCEKCTIDLSEGSLRQAVVAVIVMNLRFVDHQALTSAALGPTFFMDWDHVQARRGVAADAGSLNLLGGSQVWLQLLRSVSFQGENGTIPPEHDLAVGYPLLYGIFSALRASGCLDPRTKPGTPGRMGFDDICKIFILVNLEGVHSSHATDVYTASRLDRNTGAVITAVTTALADVRQPQSVYMHTFQYVLSMLVAEEATLMPSLQAARIARRQAGGVGGAGGKGAAKAKTRISLRRVVREMERPAVPGGGLAASSAPSVGGGDSTMSVSADASSANRTTFVEFCDSMRFPNQMSPLVQRRSYLLASMWHIFDFRQHTHRVLPDGLSQRLNANCVVAPDVGSVCSAIGTLVVRGRPFDSLLLFRSTCASKMSSSASTRLSLTDYLRMYVAAYMHREIWRDCWRRFCSVMNMHISKEIEAFVRSHKFDVDAFVNMLAGASQAQLEQQKKAAKASVADTGASLDAFFDRWGGVAAAKIQPTQPLPQVHDEQERPASPVKSDGTRDGDSDDWEGGSDADV